MSDLSFYKTWPIIQPDFKGIIVNVPVEPLTDEEKARLTKLSDEDPKL